MKKLIKVFISLSLIFSLVVAPGVTADASDGTAEEYTETESMPDENVFSRVFEEVSSYATEIFCAMTFVGSLMLAYAYKKGLLPLVEQTLISIGSAVTKIKERTESGEIAAENLGIKLDEKLNDTEKLILSLAERVGEMNEALEEVKKSEQAKEENRKDLSVIVSAQVDMLYDIFMSSALPQYQKDAVGERVAQMKEALRKDAEE